MLEHEELKRYNRQIILPELGIEGQQKLKSARVLMIGAGGLGCPVLQYLVAAGVGAIGIVDNDKVEVSNLHRQILYSTADIGKPKAAIAKQKLGGLNPFVNLTAYAERLTEANAARLIGLYDVIIDGSDNFPTRYLVNDTCAALNKPLVFGSIFKFEGQVSVFHYQKGPGYRDIFPEPPPKGEVPNCSEIGVIGVLPGMIGTYMANETIKIICGIGETLSGRLLTMNVLDNSIAIFKIQAKEQADLPPKAATNSEPPVAVESVSEISLYKLMLLLEQVPDEIHLIDVREDYEYEDYNIGGVNIPLYELSVRLDLIPKDKKIVFCCQTGHRSKMAIRIVKPFFEGELYSVKNGILR